MKRIQKREALIASLAITLTLAAVPKPLAALFKTDPVLAQSAAPAPTTGDTGVKIDGSSSMAVTNQNTIQHLKRQSPTVEAQTTLRKEQLDVNTEGNVDVNTNRDRR